MPVNMLVILAIAVLVLLALTAFFMGGFEPGPIEDEAVINSCCSPMARNQELCEEDWDTVHEPDGEVEVGGEEVPCSQYVASPSDCTVCDI